MDITLAILEPGLETRVPRFGIAFGPLAEHLKYATLFEIGGGASRQRFHETIQFDIVLGVKQAACWREKKWRVTYDRIESMPGYGFKPVSEHERDVTDAVQCGVDMGKLQRPPVHVCANHGSRFGRCGKRKRTAPCPQIQDSASWAGHAAVNQEPGRRIHSQNEILGVGMEALPRIESEQ
jgi:hypothetical protein